MACLEIVREGQVVGHITRPDGKTEVLGKRRRRFWCFKCRKRLLHTLMVFRHAQPSWYEDFAWYECPQCHEDNRSFPGF